MPRSTNAGGRASTIFLRAVAPLFAAAAVFHLWRVYSPDPTDPSGPLRHGVFVGINLCVAAGLWLRPALLRYLFGLLVVQQVSSHGAAAWRLWTAHGQIDAVSWGIVVLLPITWLVLLRQRSSGTKV